MAELMWAAKAGHPFRDPVDYHPTQLRALLGGIEFARVEIDRLMLEQRRREHWLDREVPAEDAESASPGRRAPRLQGPKLNQRAQKGPVSYDQAIYTGDPVADEWERQIAAGQTPDFERR